MAALTDAERTQWRRQIVVRFARLYPSGAPVFCTPSEAELRGERPRVNDWGNDGKVIFDTWFQAEDCARALESTGLPRQVPYECKRGTRGHHHLTKRGARKLKAHRRLR